MNVTIGGDRLGSGKKIKTYYNSYERSTHNLSYNWASSMTCGLLYPFMVQPALRGDVFEIDLDAAARTIPTQGPLFGSFKMQLDVFQCPVRLYQAILHNNPTEIGLKMSNVKFPKFQLEVAKSVGNYKTICKTNNSSLLKYLGISGIGQDTDGDDSYHARNFNAIPMLAYYDIFKTYYSNKQEQNAYVITPEQKTDYYEMYANCYEQNAYAGNIIITNNTKSIILNGDELRITSKNNEINFINTELQIKIYNSAGTQLASGNISDVFDGILEGITEGLTVTGFDYYINENKISAIWTTLVDSLGEKCEIEISPLIKTTYGSDIKITPFNLKNIDDMRMALLSFNNFGNTFVIGDTVTCEWNGGSGTDQTGMPYMATLDHTTSGSLLSQFPLTGLCLKTYQSDIFNNWVNTEWIDGNNGIAEITKIAVSDGAFKIDSLNLAEKLYNMLNRIAVSGGTYEDWQDAVYTESPRRHIESPVYLGGMSNEVVFEEIVQTAPGGDGLGTLGGRGTLVKRKGGHITVKVDEASFLIGIISLTPRIYYTQGNEWYMTELDSMNDFHKPALDGIGFQDLLGERLAWWDTKLYSDGIYSRSKIGKLPAWIEYMTNVDKAYGDFAAEDGVGFMILNRNYEESDSGYIKDATTYIDPQKYNYAFAYTALDSQNFWVQVKCDIKARRLMSAKQIPNV